MGILAAARLRVRPQFDALTFVVHDPAQTPALRRQSAIC